jgi:hypothetical protein
MVPHLAECSSPGFDLGHWPDLDKFCQTLGGLLPGMIQYTGLASEGRQKYCRYILNSKIY